MNTDPKTIRATLATVAPSTTIAIDWTFDEDANFDEISGPGYALENESPDDWQAWQSEVRATAITNGEPVVGRAYMGGTWERWGDNPHQSNPDISGYLPQLLLEAYTDLLHSLPTPHPLAAEVGAAVHYLENVLRARYDARKS